MTVKELIKKLSNYHEDKVVVLKDRSGGWCNIDYIENETSTVNLIMEDDPIFSKG